MRGWLPPVATSSQIKDHSDQTRVQMQKTDRIIRYAGAACLGLVGMLALLAATVIVTEWSGVLLFLFGR